MIILGFLSFSVWDPRSLSKFKTKCWLSMAHHGYHDDLKCIQSKTGQVAISRPRYSESTLFKRPTPHYRLRFRQSTTRFNSAFRVPVSTLRSGIPFLVLQLSYECWTNRSNTVVSQNQYISFAHVCREHNCFSSDTKTRRNSDGSAPVV